MISALRQWLYHRRLKTAQASKKNNKRSAVNYANIIGIITDHTTDLKASEALCRELQARGKKVYQLHISELKSKEPQVETIFKNEATWYGWPTSAAYVDFVSKDYDMVIMLAYSQSTTTTALLETIDADLRAGSTTYADHLDLIVDGDDASTQELIKRLKIILDKLSSNAA